MKYYCMYIFMMLLFASCNKYEFKARNGIEPQYINKFEIISDQASIENSFGGAKILRIGTISTDNFLISTDNNVILSITDTIKYNRALTGEFGYFGLNTYGPNINYSYFQADSLRNIVFFVTVINEKLEKILIGLIIIYPSEFPTVAIPRAMLIYLFNRAFSDDDLPDELLLVDYEIHGFSGDSLITYRRHLF